MSTTRRVFCSRAATLLLAPRILLAQQPGSSRSTAHPDVAAIDHDRILTQAEHYLSQSPTPLTTLPSPHSPGTPHDFYSEADNYWPDPANPEAPYTQRSGAPNPTAFTAHRDALLNLSLAVGALTSAFVLTHEDRYAHHAVTHLNAWFIEPATSMTPALLYAGIIPPAKTGRPEGIVEGVFLAEIAQSIPFLATSESLPQPTLDALTTWFTTYHNWLTTSRIAGLARDLKNHHGSSWLLQAATCARLNTKDDAPLTALRHQFKSTTIRAQILADGTFPHEIASPNPYRNSLFNLDMLAAACDLLSTRFESVWTYDLQDGPGMRSAIARHYPFMLDRGTWPYSADLNYFTALPLRRPSLLLAARAYSRPEYADLWRRLPPDTTIPPLQRTFPISQPLLWVTRPRP
ncbi:alginate lyase family protein [Edaphobacter bradus]|uniref:alginate lyase family protein n=1 Tax=Edaphobacter bradus TaxID=2259016 RepID=UPI0021DFFD28|nr:alginate lyase family protein [Edaphobacter bradus]